MSETVPVSAPIPLSSLTTIDNVFAMTYEFIAEYHTSIFMFTGTVMTAWLYNQFWVNRKFYPSMQLMQGKTVLITNGHLDTGYETSKDLLRRGARVIIVCRDIYQGRQAIRQLHAEIDCEEKNIRLMECDFSSLDSVRQFAKSYNTEEERLDVLICNANVFQNMHIVTKDGFNSVIQANYLGHFLLTNLLLDKLKQCRPSRIVNVSSNVHRIVRAIDWSDTLTQFKNNQLGGVYATSKLFQILSAYQLKKSLLATEGVNAFASSPGWVWTMSPLSMIEMIGFYPFLLAYPILRLLKMTFVKRPKTGAQAVIYCAVEPLIEQSSDLYFEHCSRSLPSWLCTDDEYADQLWNISCEAVEL